ncbi:MAG: LCP family protein [Eubacteriales bacterium]|nr:LCP family protein [Eubacteriales bacterium]
MLRRTLLVFSLLFLSVAALYWAGTTIEKNSKNAEPRGDLTRLVTQAPATTNAGEGYQLRTKLTTLLLLGIGHHAQEATVQNDGRADYLMVLVIDDERKTITPIQIDRDTATDTAQTQRINLAYGLGDGGEQSCLQTRDVVSRLFLGVDIPYFLAIDFSAAVPINDALGGVTVRLEDDFTKLDATMVSGATVMLQGQQAAYYLDTGIGTGESLMARQQAFWEACYHKVFEQLGSGGGIGATELLFDTLQPYLTTNLSRGKILNMILNTRRYQTQTTLHPEGIYSVDGQGVVTFSADQTALTQLVYQVFYQKATP